MNLAMQTSNHRFMVYSVTALLSLLISLYAYLAVDVINNDGILYISTAEAFLEGGITKAFATFGVALFPILIAWFHLVTGLTLEASAYVVNAILLAALSVVFLRVFEEINYTRLPLWVPALVVLALPILNDYRAYVVRGHGFWAFTILALLFFIIYFKKPSIQSALLWQLFALVGILFRIEGVVFIILAPFYFLLSKEKRNKFVSHYLRLNSIVVPAVVCGAIMVFGQIVGTNVQFSGLYSRLDYMMPSSLFASIQEASVGIEALMPRLSSGEAMLVSAAGLLVLVVFKLVKNINLFYLLVFAVGRQKRWIQLSQESYIVLLFFAISILPVVSIAGNQMFVSSRYTVLSVILFSLIACQYLAYLLQKLIEEKKIFAFSAMLVLVAIFFLDAIIHTGAVKGNIVVASEWMLEHINEDVKIACNNKRFAFYTKKRCSYERSIDKFAARDFDKLIEHGSYSYMLLWINGDNSKMREYLDTNKSLELLKSFTNKKQDEARVYKIMRL